MPRRGRPVGKTAGFWLGGSGGTCDQRRSRRGQRGGQLGARRDVELAEGVAEVHLDGAQRNEQSLRDLAVGEPFGGHGGDPALAGRERVDTAANETAWASAGGDELLVRSLGQEGSAAALRDLDRLEEVFAR